MTRKKEKPPISISRVFRWTVSVLALGLVGYLLVDNWVTIRESVLEIGLTRFLLLLGLALGSRFFMVLRWHLILRSAGEKVSFFTSLRVTYAGFFANNFMPSTIGGDVFRLTAAVVEKIEGGIAAASLVMDRIVGMVGMLLFLPFGVIRLSGYNNLQSGLEIPQDLVFSGALLNQLNSKKGKVFDWIRRAWQKLWDTIKLWVRRPWSLIPSLIATMAHQTCLYGLFGIMMDSFNESMTFWLIGGLWSVVYFVTLVPVSINGLGVQEVVIIFAFHTLGGTSESFAITLAVVFRIVMLLVSLPGALSFMSLMPKVKSEEEYD